MTEADLLTYKKVIKAPADLIYRAFTSASALREWLCDIATVNLDEGGWIFLAWNRGYFANGHYLKLIPNKAVSFTWIGKDEPHCTKVDVSISPLENDSVFLVELRHTGLGDGAEWELPRKEMAKGWALGFENLKNTLEEGRDLRLVNRPLIGIYPEDLNDLTNDAREKLDLPVDYGVVVTNVLPGYGAEKAGMQSNDVIVAIEGKKVERIKSLGLIINEFKPGDQLAVEVFRGPDKKILSIDTMVQKFDLILESPEELAKELESRSSKMIESFESVFKGVSDAEASYSPGAEEWSAKEVLIHLIHNEREVHSWINDLVAGQERFYDQWPGNQLFRIKATLTTYPGVDDLITEFRRSLKETVASIALLKPNFTRRKASYTRLAMALLDTPKHVDEHIQQIKDNIQAARTASTN
ncbi:MAG: SRPBCC domain-containing protein [Chloroflexota bacterium]|nr:SRPBCC domain-containing protein [Chloroflexota bacterium]